MVGFGVEQHTGENQDEGGGFGGWVLGPTDGSNRLWRGEDAQLQRFLNSSPQVAASCPALERKNADLKT